MDTLYAVAQDIEDCRLCPRLVEWRENVALRKRASFANQTYWGRGVPGFGDPMASLVIVGLAPAAHGANRTGRMFTGDRSGDFLFDALHRAGYANKGEATSVNDGLKLSGAYITSSVKCAPPANKPSSTERSACQPYLKREFALLSGARVFLVLGKIGYTAACQEFGIAPRPKFAHGLEINLSKGRTLLSSYHVSQQNTFTGRLTREMFDSILVRAQELAFPWPDNL